MGDIGLSLLRHFLLFCRYAVGVLNKPYITYRKLAEGKTDDWHVSWIALLTLFYFAFASILRTGMYNPYLLTIKFNSLVIGAFGGFGSIVLLLFCLGKILGYTPSFRTLIVLWGYSLLPTLLWFFATSLSYSLFPSMMPASMVSKLSGVIFLSFSIAMLLWKGMLYYLTIRFSLHADLFRMSLISLVLLPWMFFYAIFVYDVGIFRVPFL